MNKKVDLVNLETLEIAAICLITEKSTSIFFAKTGFTKGRIDKVSEMGNEMLIDYDKILKT